MGVPASEALKRFERPSISDVRLILWALLVRHHRLDLRRVGKLIDRAGVQATIRAMADATDTGFPERTGKKRGEENPRWRVSRVFHDCVSAGMMPEAFWDSTPSGEALPSGRC